MSTQQFAPSLSGCYRMARGTDGLYAVAPDGSHRGPFDTVEEVAQATIEAAISFGARTPDSQESPNE